MFGMLYSPLYLAGSGAHVVAGRGQGYTPENGLKEAFPFSANEGCADVEADVIWGQDVGFDEVGDQHGIFVEFTLWF